MTPSKHGKKRTVRARTSESTEILFGMSRCPWSSYWAASQEEQGERFSGVDIYKEAPTTPAWAKKWADQLADKIIILNTDRRGRTSDKAGLEGLYEEAVAEGYPGDREQFGVHLAAQATGMGIHWTDDLSRKPHLEIIVPYDEFYPR
jgi:hypothetical protein